MFHPSQVTPADTVVAVATSVAAATVALVFEIFNMPARLLVHQSQLIATLSARGERSEEVLRARQRFLASRQDLGQSPVPPR